jgi:endonuclease YncB( thermonuclease family)
MRFETLLLLSILTACAPALGAVTVPASAVSIVDGDTVRYDGQKVRLKGWDTPEPRTGFKCEIERALGREASAEAQRLLDASTTVTFVFMEGTDRYGRLLGHYAFDGENVGELLARKGLAQRWDYDGGQAKPLWC